jgi:competence protein ComEC
MRSILTLTFPLLIAATLAIAQTRPTLDIYVIDVEGGNATLFVSPAKESLLIDTGNAGAVAAVRDANRIMDAIKDAGLTQIDHLITTHWHGDHFGGLQELAGRIPIREFIDHGPNAQPNATTDEFIKTTYPQLYAKAKHTVPRPGDTISIRGLNVRVITSAGQTIKSPLPGAGGANPYCASFKPNPGNAEDPQSVGVHVTFGEFRTIHFGDLTRDKEFELMCPNNRLGVVDVLLGLHHGQPTSNSPVLVHATQPRVAIMNNGTRKGGDPETMQTLHLSPGLEDLWQIHFSQLSGQEYTVAGIFIANVTDDPQQTMPVAAMPLPGAGNPAPAAPAHNGPAYWIKVSAQQDGTFSVTNARNQFTKVYVKRR